MALEKHETMKTMKTARGNGILMLFPFEKYRSLVVLDPVPAIFYFVLSNFFHNNGPIETGSLM